MIAFEVRLNGKKICTAGIRELGNLCAHLDWSRGPQVALATGFQHRDELLELQIAGCRIRYKPKKAPNFKPGFKYAESLEWIKRKVRAGDEVSIRVIEARRADRPRKRQKLP